MFGEPTMSRLQRTNSYNGYFSQLEKCTLQVYSMRMYFETAFRFTLTPVIRGGNGGARVESQIPLYLRENSGRVVLNRIRN